ncbi:MAG: transposase [Desulforhopalus sp.]|nr:transposase [Desulforhopalus sp.]
MANEAIFLRPRTIHSGLFPQTMSPGTFEYTLNYLIDNELYLSVFDDRLNNDITGAPGYDPRILLKVILFAYSRGISSSRKMARCCEENILFMALSAGSKPHFTTIADFIASMNKEVIHLFLQVLMVCDHQQLIGKDMFAIDGCKLPSKASKEWSGTRADFAKKIEKMESAITRMVEKHQAQDQTQTEACEEARENQYKAKLQKNVAKIKKWLDNNDDRTGCGGKPVKSNITDNESAKMKTSKGVIQGYVGVASVDQKTQVIVSAEAFGKGQEHDLLLPSVNGIRDNFSAIGHDGDVLAKAKVTADSGYHSEKNMEALFSANIDAYVADPNFRKRDPRFTTATRHKEKEITKPLKGKLFTTADFTFPEDFSYCVCPAGNRLYRSGYDITVKNFKAIKFKGPKSACVPCKLRARCLRKPEKTEIRQVVFFTGRSAKGEQRFTEKMKEKIDSTKGRAIYGMRLAVGEPPFAHIRSALGLDRFTLRGKAKVNTQWNLFCIVHNLLKIFRYGVGFA